MAYEYYLTSLGVGAPKDAMGIYEHSTGRCVYYSDGKGPWFFEMGTGKPSFYVADGQFYFPNGKPATLSIKSLKETQE